MPGLAAVAPDRVTNIHREASAPSSPPHEADKAALEEQLEGTRITRKGDPSSFHPHLKWWLQEDNVLQCQPLHLLNMLFNGYRCIKKVGFTRRRTHCKGNLVPSRSRLHIKLSGTKAFIWPLKNSKTSG